MKKTTYQVPEIRDENDNIVQEGTFGKKSAFVSSSNDGAFDYILNDLEALHDAQTDSASTFTTAALTVTGTTSVPTANSDNNSTTIANTAFVKTALANFVGSAPSTLDTLQELATALGNDANFSATVTKKIGEKLDKAGGTITGPILYDKTPNDDTELPNKAYVDAAINSAVAAVTKTLSDNMHAQYPVGSYIYSDKADNPATYLPYMSDTTWVQTAAGRVLIGAGTAYSGTVYTAGQTGGEEKHKLTVDELPNVKGSIQFRLLNGDSNIVACSMDNSTDGVFTYKQYQGSKWGGSIGAGPSATENTDIISMNFGNYTPHNNMPPYAAVYVFHRTK